ncbi:MAG: hypothetical protein RH917_19470 [Lacipirellulaceae bacterium]
MLRRLPACLACSLLLYTVAIVSVSAATSSYHIGNSLTWDSQPKALESFAAARGKEHEAGYHIRTSSSLAMIEEHHDAISRRVTNSAEHGRYREALPSHKWDAVTIQPFASGGSTFADDLDVIHSMIDLTQSNPANDQTQFYIYGGWRNRNGYRSIWERESSTVETTRTVQSRDYYEDVVRRVREETDAEVYLIPVGEVISRLDYEIEAGAIPGFDSFRDLYRDNIHMSYSVGRFLASLTTFAVTQNESPYGMEVPEDFFGGSKILSAEQQIALQEVVAEVINANDYTGTAYFANPYEMAPSISIAAIPEPASLLLASGIILLTPGRPSRLSRTA